MRKSGSHEDRTVYKERTGWSPQQLAGFYLKKIDAEVFSDAWTDRKSNKIKQSKWEVCKFYYIHVTFILTHKVKPWVSLKPLNTGPWAVSLRRSSIITDSTDSSRMDHGCPLHATVSWLDDFKPFVRIVLPSSGSENMFKENVATEAAEWGETHSLSEITIKLACSLFFF